IPVLAFAGPLARAPRQEPGAVDFPIRGPLFITLLIITVLLIGGLSFLPVLALGPVAEHLSLMQGAF
ncbi:potassium-transporting ATPase subunit KdpA, partial [Aliarcobacter cryaerophilus]